MGWSDGWCELLRWHARYVINVNIWYRVRQGASSVLSDNGMGHWRLMAVEEGIQTDLGGAAENGHKHVRTRTRARVRAQIPMRDTLSRTGSAMVPAETISSGRSGVDGPCRGRVGVLPLIPGSC